MKKILFMVSCVALLASCGSTRVDAMVDSTVTEAIVLQDLARAHGAEVTSQTSNLVADAKKHIDGEDKDVDRALLNANEAILLLQISLLEKEKKNIEDSLFRATETLRINRTLLSERKGK